ncbi:MAG: MerR family transcriptional regulator [Deltaproteobacteria bacterium]|nr:MAG: MerR family transcriptional regulator [Deltaproteobacteria bacterium]
MVIGKSAGKAAKDKEKAPGLKMKDLVAASGLPKSTILHYLNEGLLPPPVKTSRNMAYYDPVCVERLNFIKFLQKRHRLPLEEIKTILQGPQPGREFLAFQELNAAVFGRQPEEGELLNPKAFCLATGLSLREVKELKAAGVLLPLKAGEYDAEDVAMGRLLQRALALGVAPEECGYYQRYAEEIVDREMAVRERLTSHLPPEQNARLTLELTRAARALRAYVIDRVFQHRVMALRGDGTK